MCANSRPARRSRAVAGLGPRRCPRRLRAAGHARAVPPPDPGRRPRPRRQAHGHRHRHRLRKIAGLPAAGTGRDPPFRAAGPLRSGQNPRRRRRDPVPVPDQGAGRRPAGRHQVAEAAHRPGRNLRRRHRPRVPALDPGPRQLHPGQPGHAALRHPAQPCLVGPVLPPAALRDRGRSPQLPRRLRLPCGQPDAPAAPDLRLLRCRASTRPGVHRGLGHGRPTPEPPSAG